jgi:hypothetical protein
MSEDGGLQSRFYEHVPRLLGVDDAFRTVERQIALGVDQPSDQEVQEHRDADDQHLAHHNRRAPQQGSRHPCRRSRSLLGCTRLGSPGIFGVPTA